MKVKKTAYQELLEKLNAIADSRAIDEALHAKEVEELVTREVHNRGAQLVEYIKKFYGKEAS